MIKENVVQQPNDTRLFWLQWTLATLAGYTLGTLALLPLVVNLAYANQPALLRGFVGGALLGVALGVAQWLVLRRHIVVGGRWILASLGGGALGLALGMVLADMIALPSFTPTTREAAAAALPLRVALQTGVTGAVVGVVLGGAQWLALRRSLRSAGWWLLANGLGWMAGMALGALIADRASVIGALLVTGIISGVIIGLALQRWIEQER